MSDLKKLEKDVVDFRDARDWKQFHNPKDIALSLMLEAAEVLEHFQWKNSSELDEYLEDNVSKIGDELADVLSYALLLSHELGIDLEEAFNRKLQESDNKYPVEKSKGKHAKYTEL